jgi:DNA-binding NtrC family response regulator
VRQLENLVEKAVVMSGDRWALLAADFPLPKDVAHADFNRATIPLVVPDDGLDFAATVSSFEKSILEPMLHTTNGKRKRWRQIGCG